MLNINYNYLNIQIYKYYIMYNYIVSFFQKKHSYSYPSQFSKQYIKGYKNAWIDNIKDYTP